MSQDLEDASAAMRHHFDVNLRQPQRVAFHSLEHVSQPQCQNFPVFDFNLFAGQDPRQAKVHSPLGNHQNPVVFNVMRSSGFRNLNICALERNPPVQMHVHPVAASTNTSVRRSILTYAQVVSGRVTSVVQV